jgi:anaerobic magnesium-protoporphyrin IX monomethyl ester cyclase
MKILFVLTTIGSKAKWHQGIASLATFLRKNGYQADLLEVHRFDLPWIEREVRRYGPDILAATANSHQFPYVARILKDIKNQLPQISTILGGVHVTINPDIIKRLEGVDAVCRGEGEGPLLEYVQAIEHIKDPEGIENLSFPQKSDGSLHPCTYYVKDLTSLPIPDRSLFRAYREATKGEPIQTTVRFLFCRGCPFNCSYCCNKTIKESFPDTRAYVRWPSVGRAIEEIESVSEQYRFDRFVIDDDIFTLNKRWAVDFCNKYPERLRRNKTFEVNVRIGTVDEDLMRALKGAGCNLIKIGLESGDEAIRREVLNRKITDEMIFETAALAKKIGIRFHTFNMVGIPGETRRSILKTVAVNRRIRPERVQVTIFYPYKNTSLGDHCFQKGMIDGSGDTYFRKSVLRHDKMFRMEIEFYALVFKLLIYSGYSLRKAVEELEHIVEVLPGIRQIKLLGKRVFRVLN